MEFERELTEPLCPQCGATELASEDVCNVDCLKVWDERGGWSHCLVCDYWFLDSPNPDWEWTIYDEFGSRT